MFEKFFRRKRTEELEEAGAKQPPSPPSPPTKEESKQTAESQVVFVTMPASGGRGNVLRAIPHERTHSPCNLHLTHTAEMCRLLFIIPKNTGT